MQRIPFTSFNLRATLESGQIFRYDPMAKGYLVQHADCAIYCEQRQNLLFYDGVHSDGRIVNEDEVRHFFRLDETHGRLLGLLEKDRRTKDLCDQYRGIHLLRQDLHECTIAFMCSSAANIPKIKMNITKLCEAFGTRFEFRETNCYAFPQPGTMNNIAKIKRAKTGFRAKYLYAANKILNTTFLEQLQRSPYQDAKRMLLAIPGIGEKVADCVLLFALDHTNSFPVDTWMHKTMIERYEDELRTHIAITHGARIHARVRITPEHISAFGEHTFGEAAGLAQQFMFVDARKRKIRSMKQIS